jgi:hypothetical protein
MAAPGDASPNEAGRQHSEIFYRRFELEKMVVRVTFNYQITNLPNYQICLHSEIAIITSGNKILVPVSTTIQ